MNNQIDMDNLLDELERETTYLTKKAPTQILLSSTSTSNINVDDIESNSKSDDTSKIVNVKDSGDHNTSTLNDDICDNKINDDTTNISNSSIGTIKQIDALCNGTKNEENSELIRNTTEHNIERAHEVSENDSHNHEEILSICLNLTNSTQASETHSYMEEETKLVLELTTSAADIKDADKDESNHTDDDNDDSEMKNISILTEASPTIAADLETHCQIDDEVSKEQNNSAQSFNDNDNLPLLTPTNVSNTEMEEHFNFQKSNDNSAICDMSVREDVIAFVSMDLTASDKGAAVSENLETTPIGNEVTVTGENVEASTSTGISDIPCTSASLDESGALLGESTRSKSVIESTHDISVIKSEFKLTESELQIGKSKPYWIPDVDCITCMLCSAKFTLVNRRHHCRCCGRVLCGSCCQIRRILPYMYEEETEPRKQRICVPCNKTLDRIESYEKFLSEQVNSASTSATGRSNSTNDNTQSVPTRKKSVLKVRTCTIDSTNGSEATNSPPIKLNNDGSTPDPATPSDTEHPKRNVVFRDGVKPGSDPSDASTPSETPSQANEFKRSSKRLSRKTMEKRIDEEYVSLLLPCEHVYRVRNCESELCSTESATIWREIENGAAVTIAIRRNVHAVVQVVELEESRKHLSVSTRGFNMLGVEELVIIIECSLTTFDLKAAEEANTQPESNSNVFSANTDSNGSSSNEARLTMNIRHLRELLGLVEHIFGRCISPMSVEEKCSHPDDRLGIRRCSQRMRRFYEFCTSSIAGVQTAGIYLMRPLGQTLGQISLPSGPFFVGILFKKAELIWGNCLPDRVLYAIGRKYSSYPTIVYNPAEREAVFTTESANFTVLKVLNDFRNFNYRIAKIEDSFVSLMDTETHVIIPKWAQDQLKALIETNRNMFGWSLDFNTKADSHLTCCEESSGEEIELKTHIFSRDGLARKVTGASFIIFDGALRAQSSNETFTVSFVEDGVIVRMNADTMASFTKSCETANDFELTSADMRISVRFLDVFSPEIDTRQPPEGQISSPIDTLNMTGNYQYGLVMTRALRSLCQFRNSTEWALRLAAVVNLDSGKFPIRVQSKFFETCEQLMTFICHTLEPFLDALVITNQRSIYVRIHVSSDFATYETATWPNLEDQHEAWTAGFDETVIPILYGICPLAAISTVPLNVELHFQIVSIRQLNFCCVPLSSRTLKYQTVLSPSSSSTSSGQLVAGQTGEGDTR